MKNVKVELEIESCEKCPFKVVTRNYSTDGWDRVEDWKCTKVDKIIEKMIGTFENVAIPKWCPYGENINEKEFLEWIEDNDLKINFVVRPYKNNCKQFGVSVNHLEIINDSILESPFGNGDTLDEAIIDLCSKIYNKYAVLHAYSNRHEFSIPPLKHTLKY